MVDDKIRAHLNALSIFDRDASTGKPRWFYPMLLAAVFAALLFLCFWFGRSFARLSSTNRLLYGAEGSNPAILVIKLGNRYGYGDASGNVILPPVYEDARPFFEGLAAVKKNGRYGYIDTEGNTVIPFQFVDALDFHNGNAVVGTKWVVTGFLMYRPNCCIIDREGKILREVNVHSLSEYSEGLYRVGDIQFMDSGGNMILNESNLGFFPSVFHEGLTQVYSGFYSFVDRAGNPIGQRFTGIGDFSEGLAPVMESKWGYIDRTGAFVIEPKFEKAFGFGEGRACVKKAQGEWIIIDAEGNEVCEIQLNPPEIDSLGEGLTVVKDSDGWWVVKDRSGREVASFPGDFSEARAFREGMCAVAMEKPAGAMFERPNRWRYATWLWGFIDTSGKLVVPCIYEQVSDFHGGIAQVMLPDGKIGYIDKAGKYFWEPK